MAIDFIHVDTSTTTATNAGMLLNLVQAMRTAYDQVGQVKRTMGHMNDGTDFTLIEQKFGLEAGKGQVMFDLVNGAAGSMEGLFQVDDARTLTERVG